MTQSSREAKLPVHFVIEKLTLRIPFSLQYKYPLYHEIWRASKENFERETLEKHKID